MIDIFPDFCLLLSRFLYPKPVAALEETPAGADKEEEISEGQRDGQYELFTQVDDTIRDQIQDLILTGNHEI